MSHEFKGFDWNEARYQMGQGAELIGPRGYEYKVTMQQICTAPNGEPGYGTVIHVTDPKTGFPAECPNLIEMSNYHSWTLA